MIATLRYVRPVEIQRTHMGAEVGGIVGRRIDPMTDGVKIFRRIDSVGQRVREIHPSAASCVRVIRHFVLEIEAQNKNMNGRVI